VLLIIFLALLLLFAQALLPGYFLTAQVGSAKQMGGRDNLPEPTVELARSRRALGNLQETLPIFLTLAVLCIILGEEGWLPVLGGALFLVGRVAHVICYMRALAPWRSVSFALAMLGIVLVAMPLVPHIWR
jgi:uncharacterized MAPEG superfamily protein